MRGVAVGSYDVVVNLHRHASSGVLTALSMANIRVGYANNPLRGVSHIACNTVGAMEHMRWSETALLSPFVAKVKKAFEPRLYPGEAHVQEAEEVGARGAVLVMPGSQWATKAWPEGQFGKLLDEVTDQVILMGAPRERPLCDRLAQGRPNVSNAAGELSLLGLVAAVQNGQSGRGQ